MQVLRDDHGIPQVYADNSADLFYAQGFVQAQDRFFEMDFRRHVTAGRISELLGEKTVETDMYIRTMGWRRVAAREYDLLEPSTRAYLDAYSDGVNAYLAGKSATQLSAGVHRARPRRPRLQARRSGRRSTRSPGSRRWRGTSRGNMDEEIARTRLSLGRTPEQVDELYPRYPYDRHAPIVPTAGRRAGATRHRDRRSGPAALQALEAVRRGVDAIPDLMGHGEGIGSNSWVVSGEHTVSGKPLLANDPHLNASIPGIWYQMGLHCRTVERRLPVRRQRLHLLRPARRGDRPQPRHRLGDDQPRPGRQRPLPGEDHRQDLSLRRTGRCRWPSATR